MQTIKDVTRYENRIQSNDLGYQVVAQVPVYVPPGGNDKTKYTGVAVFVTSAGPRQDIFPIMAESFDQAWEIFDATAREHARRLTEQAQAMLEPREMGRTPSGLYLAGDPPPDEAAGKLARAVDGEFVKMARFPHQ